MENTVFISHTGTDKDIAREIGLFLTSENINVWFDEWGIRIGESITEEINNGLAVCTHFIIIWSNNAKNSRWVKREINSAMHMSIEKEVKLLPILIDDTELPPLIADKLYFRYEGGTEKDRNSLITAITGDHPSNNYIKAIVKKYNEVIYDYESDNILPFKACPICGATYLEHIAYNSPNDHIYFMVSCKECGWSEWTE